MKGLALRVTETALFNRAMKRFSNRLFAGIDGTPPVATSPSAPIVIYSVLDERNVSAYLLALKSFLRFSADSPVAVVVQNDGSLSARSVARLHRHVPGIAVLGLDETFQFLEESIGADLRDLMPPLREACFFLPLKLLNVIYRFPRRYVILLDSDIVFIRRPTEVFESLRPECYQNFHSDGGNGLAKQFRAMGFDFPYVDVGRFNAGFFGFFNSLSAADVQSVVSQVAKHDKALFMNWEIEQALWSVLLNRCGESRCLRNFKESYVGNGWRSYEELLANAVLVHFVGTTRYRDWSYPRLARRIFEELQSQQVAAAHPCASTQSAGAGRP